MQCSSMYPSQQAPDSRAGASVVLCIVCQYQQEVHKLIHDIKEATHCKYTNTYNVKSFYIEYKLMCNIKFDVDVH